MDWNQILTPLLAGLGVIITGLCTWISTRVVAWLNSKIKDKEAAKLATSLATIILNATRYVFQTYVESLKKSGNFNEDAQKEALTKCLDLIKGQLTVELKDYITATFGDLDSYLRTAIESTIYSLKNTILK